MSNENTERNKRRLNMRPLRAGRVEAGRFARIVAGEGVEVMKSQNVRIPGALDERIEDIVRACSDDPDVARLVLGYGSAVSRSTVVRALLGRGAAEVWEQIRVRNPAA